MAKCILCLGNNTKIIAEDKLDNNVGGIELLSCPFVSDLDKKIKSSGKIDKIIISQSAINEEIPDTIISKDFNTVIILTDKDLMEQYDIRFFGNTNISIVDNSANGGKTTVSFLKELIVANTIDDYLLYKSNNIIQEKEDESEQEATNIIEESNENTDFERELEQEDKPIVLNGNEESVNLEFEEEEVKPTREISLDTEKTIISTGKVETPEETIRKIIKLYSQGCVLVFTGAFKSYSTQNCYKVAKILSKLDLTVGLIDLDTINYPMSVLTNKLFNNSISFNKRDTVAQALKMQNVIEGGGKLIDNNFVTLTGSPIQNPIDWKEKQNIMSLLETVQKERFNFNVLLLNIPLESLNTFGEILKISNKIIYTLPATNEDYLCFMRNIELCDTDLRDKLFTNSCYIAINEGIKLLNTNKTDIAAIDDFLYKNFEISDDIKYEHIRKVGTCIQKDLLEEDYLNKGLKINKKEIMDIILRVIER